MNECHGLLVSPTLTLLYSATWSFEVSNQVPYARLSPALYTDLVNE